jgi:formylglycine-generating enzyme required for sulfatase activity
VRRRAIVVVGIAFAGCRATLGIHDPEIEPEAIESGAPDGDVGADGGDAGPTTDAPIDVLADVVDGAAPMVQVTIPAGAGGGTFFIDRHEVTQAEYNDFLQHGPTTASQGPECAPNTTFVPERNFTPTGTPNLPVTNIDWCDAIAYCKYVGKRLCGGLLGARGNYAEAADPSKNEWMIACTNGGSQPFPYGATEKPLACNVHDAGAGKTLDVGTKTGCEGAIPGLFDMVGNATEWVDHCDVNDGGPAGNCAILGGSYNFPPTGTVACSALTASTKNAAFDDLSFRCCTSVK